MTDDSTFRGRLVVGYDGSDSSSQAARWAAGEARARGRELIVLYVLLPPTSSGGFGVGLPPSLDLLAQLEDSARAEVEAAVEQLRVDVPGVRVTPVLTVGSPSSALLDASRSADLVVVGSRGHGGFTGLLLGSVGAQVAAHAECPVVVIRQPAPSGASSIVVGIDGSPAAEAALRFAFDEASRHGWSIQAVHAWDVPAYDLIIVPNGPVPVPLSNVADDEVRLTSEILAGFRDDYPDVEVIENLVRAPAVMALLDASKGAAMVVVGSHGHGPAIGALLGSVSHGLVHRATLPVVVVPPDHEPETAA
ncbi:MAG TPA: universal stress protein UspA [Actinobacteria bacterium]|nr:universal stress protein UspA [Actinomycetota bacterium]